MAQGKSFNISPLWHNQTVALIYLFIFVHIHIYSRTDDDVQPSYIRVVINGKVFQLV